MVKVLQGSVVTQTVLGGLTINPLVVQLRTPYSVHVLNIMKIGWQ